MNTHPQLSKATHIADLLPASLLAMALATGPYALVVEGHTLAPRIQHGDVVGINPAVGTDPASVPAGSAVLAVVASDPAKPHQFDRPALFHLNADGDLVASGGTIEAGRWLLLGIVREDMGTPQRSA